jgi:hypothetical protein
MKEIKANPKPAGIQNHFILDESLGASCPFVEQNRGLDKRGGGPHFFNQPAVGLLVQTG